MKRGSGSWRVAELLSKSALTEAEAEDAVRPITSLLDRIFDRTWSLAKEQSLTDTTRKVRKIISRSIAGVTCNKIAWVSLSKSLNPKKPNWLSDSEFADTKEKYAERMLGILVNKLGIPLCKVIWLTDLSGIEPDKMYEVDGFWADLSDALPGPISACMDRQLDQSNDFGTLEDISDLMKYAIYRTVCNYLTMRYFGLIQESERLIPLLQLMDQGVLPIGIARPYRQGHMTWLVIIA